MRDMDIEQISKATIRQAVSLSASLEQILGEPFSRLEIGVPGLKACREGIEAQKRALDDGIPAKYPSIEGLPALKNAASRFLKAFVDIDVEPQCIVPTVGSMQGSYNLTLACSQLTPGRDTMLYIQPGFPANLTQAKVLGVRHEAFDIYEYRGEKLREKLESYFATGRIAALLFSNPNNPTWVCLTDEELRIIGELANKYDVIVLEDMAYMCMDFRNDLSHPFEAPYQPTVARYTDNYVIMLSASKIFSYAGERIALVAFNNTLFKRRFEGLRERYGMARMGQCFIHAFLYAASTGTSHSAQYAMAAMLQGAVDGTLDFVKDVSEYGRRAKIVKEIFVKHGFHIVYDHDGERPIADGFFFTAGYRDMDDETLMRALARCGISAIGLNTTGSGQYGIRVCVSALCSDEDFRRLDERLALFAENF